MAVRTLKLSLSHTWIQMQKSMRRMNKMRMQSPAMKMANTMHVGMHGVQHPA